MCICMQKLIRWNNTMYGFVEICETEWNLTFNQNHSKQYDETPINFLFVILF